VPVGLSRPSRCPRPIKVEPSPAPDLTERRQLYVFGQDVKWLENGKWQTACAYSVINPPADIAAKGIKHNLCDDLGSLRSVNMRAVHGMIHGVAKPLDECIDLVSAEPSAVKYIDEKSRNPNFHSSADQFQHDQRASWVRDGSREQTGTVSVSRN
jgi:hypothetical protein